MDADLAGALQKAAAHFGRGELSSAETICRRLLESYPDATDALHLLALVIKQRGEYDEAERLLRDCIRIDPGRPDIHANLGNLLNTRGQSNEAEMAYRKASSVDPSFRPARLGLARLLCKTGRGDDAAEEALILLGRNRKDAEALNVLGSARRLQQRPEEAEAAFREALSVSPAYAVARHNLGALLTQQSRSEEALVELELAARAGVQGEEIDVNRASALMALNRFDAAESLLRSAVRMSPHATNAHSLLARLQFMRGNEHFAREYADAVTKHPDDVLLRIGYSRVLRGAGLFAEAQSALQTGHARHDRDSRVLAELAGVSLDLGQFDDALKFASAAAAIDPDGRGLDDLTIDALTCLGRASEARALVIAARSRDPLNQWYVAMQATTARLLGDPEYESLYDYDAFVGEYELSPPSGWSSIKEFHKDLIPALNARHQLSAEPLDQSLRKGTQTPRGLLGDPDPVIQAFLGAIREPLDDYQKALGFDPGHPLLSRNKGECDLIGCWSVRLKRGGFHVNHVHSEGWISSAYYVDVPAEVADESAKSGWIKFGEPRFPVPGAPAEKFVQPRAGHLILFPSYMWHGTTPVSGDRLWNNRPRASS